MREKRRKKGKSITIISFKNHNISILFRQHRQNVNSCEREKGELMKIYSPEDTLIIFFYYLPKDVTACFKCPF